MNNSGLHENTTWNDAYKLDIEVIDHQHETFFKIYDELVSSKASNKSDTVIKATIDKLLDYTSVHFTMEEALLEKSNYLDIDEQKRQHRFFINRIEDLKIAHAHKNPLLYTQLLTFARKWFLSHISQVDARYKETVTTYLTSKNTGNSQYHED